MHIVFMLSPYVSVLSFGFNPIDRMHHVKMNYRNSTYPLVIARMRVHSFGAAEAIVRMAFSEVKGSRSLPTSSSDSGGQADKCPTCEQW